MSRSGYSDEVDDQQAFAMYRGRVASATRGKRGQEFFKALAAAMDAMPVKALIANSLENDHGNVCALGALGDARGVDLSAIDPEDAVTVAQVFDIAVCLAREVVYMNDEGYASYFDENPAERWTRMRQWVERQIKQPA